MCQTDIKLSLIAVSIQKMEGHCMHPRMCVCVTYWHRVVSWQRVFKARSTRVVAQTADCE